MSPWHYDALIGSTDPIPKKLDAALGKLHFSTTGPLVPSYHFSEITNSRPSRRQNPQSFFHR